MLHFVVFGLNYESLFEATQSVSSLLKSYDIDTIHFMVNWCAGSQDVFQIGEDYQQLSGAKNKGNQPITQAANLLVYYYK